MKIILKKHRIATLIMMLHLIPYTTFSSPAAEDISLDQEKDMIDYTDYLNPEIGDNLIPKIPVNAWESYPKGVFISRGKRITTLKPGMIYVVLRKKTLSTIFFGNQYYLQMNSANSLDDDPCITTPCWVYLGNDRDRKQPVLLPESYYDSED